MKLSQRRAVSPIIATLLLIAISVASGIVVYVFTNGLAANLTKSGGNQVTEQLSMVAYNYISPGASGTLTLYIQNTGSGSVNVASYYQNGAPVTPSTPCTNPVNPQTTCTAVFTVGSGSFASEVAEASVAIKVVTTNGATFTFNVVAGQTG